MAEYLIHLVEQYGYVGVFLLALFDHTGVPGGLLLSIGVATAGYLDVSAVFIISFVGGLVGDVLFYLIGLFGGRKILKRLSVNREALSERLDKATALFKEKGKSAVLWGRFPPVVGKYVMALAGILDFSFYKFLILSVLGGILMVMAYGIPYYFLGSGLNDLFASKTFALYLTVIVLVLHLLGFWGWTIWKKRRG